VPRRSSHSRLSARAFDQLASCSLSTARGLWGRERAIRHFDVTTRPVATLAGATVVPLSGVTAIQGGGDFLCANTPQALRCWGDDSAGQLGKGTNPLHTVPQVVANPPIVANALAGGDTTSCAIASGQVYCWGQNAFAQLGDGTLLQRRTPALVPGIATAGAIALGTQHGCAALADGTVQCWGDNALRQLGDGTLTARTTPVLVPSLAADAMFERTLGGERGLVARRIAEANVLQGGAYLPRPQALARITTMNPMRITP
jgi:hypothetical protein